MKIGMLVCIIFLLCIVSCSPPPFPLLTASGPEKSKAQVLRPIPAARGSEPLPSSTRTTFGLWTSVPMASDWQPAVLM